MTLVEENILSELRVGKRPTWVAWLGSVEDGSLFMVVVTACTIEKRGKRNLEDGSVLCLLIELPLRVHVTMIVTLMCQLKGI